jgi:hypothetical protein
MAPRCFRKKESNPPACGLHNVTLEHRVIAIDENVPLLGRVICFVCPVSGSVLGDAEVSHPRD